MSSEKQADKILAYLEKGHTVPPKLAAEKFSCWRLAARIYDLRKRGHDIRTDLLGTTNGQCAEYKLVQDP